MNLATAILTGSSSPFRWTLLANDTRLGVRSFGGQVVCYNMDN